MANDQWTRVAPLDDTIHKHQWFTMGPYTQLCMQNNFILTRTWWLTVWLVSMSEWSSGCACESVNVYEFLCWCLFDVYAYALWIIFHNGICVMTLFQFSQPSPLNGTARLVFRFIFSILFYFSFFPLLVRSFVTNSKRIFVALKKLIKWQHKNRKLFKLMMLHVFA